MCCVCVVCVLCVCVLCVCVCVCVCSNVYHKLSREKSVCGALVLLYTRLVLDPSL
jgi:hypothetical protein